MNEPGVLPPASELRTLGRVSPSHATGLWSCALREIWAANRTPGLLPSTPTARLGTVAHRLLEEAGRGMLSGRTGSGIEDRWDELLLAAEEDLAKSWLDRHLLPLSASVPDFEVRKLQAIARAGALASEASGVKASPAPDAGPPLGFEVAVTTPDGRAGGRIDAVVPTEDGPVIRDYKSGAIYERAGDIKSIKPEYAVQLKLYAAIYAKMTGIWPVRLEVVPLVGASEPVAFSPDECVQMLEEVLQLCDSINRTVESDMPLATKMDQLANPSPSACGYCAYRPQCMPYRQATKPDPDGWPLDIRGRLIEKRTLGNGRIMLTLGVEGGAVCRIRGLNASPERHPAIQLAVDGDTLAAFSLRADGNPSSFVEGRFTVIYWVDSLLEE